MSLSVKQHIAYSGKTKKNGALNDRSETSHKSGGIIKIQEKCTKQEVDIAKNHKIHLQPHLPNYSQYTKPTTQTKMDSASHSFRKWLQCPCGEVIKGPIHFIVHIQSFHQHENIEDIMAKKLSKEMMDNKRISGQQLKYLQSKDQFNLIQRLLKISNKYRQQEFERITCLQRNQINASSHSYYRMSTLFIEQMAGQQILINKILLQFFRYLQAYICHQYGTDSWETKSPQSLLKEANYIIICYQHFNRINELNLCLDTEDVKSIFYVLTKWMFNNSWTTDRLFENVFDATFQNENEQSINSELNSYEYNRYKNEKVRNNDGYNYNRTESEPELYFDQYSSEF